MKRPDSLARLRSAGPFDLLVIGGGATGLGIALDAASRGYSIGLIEQADFAKGTSSRSTKLVHGGVRYLRQGNVPLVLESLRERGRLLRNAPHLVKALGFVIPIHRWRDGLIYGLGMKLYDRLAGRSGLGRSERLSRAETIERLPTVKTDGLVGGVLYHDAQFDDARVAVALALTADRHGAVLVNHCRCIGLLKEAGRVCGVRARDEESAETFDLRARVVVNATGVFVDDIRRLDVPAAPGLVRVSQGIHCVLPRRFLPGADALMVPRTADGRVLFAVPWQDRVVVGTTDTPVSETSLEPRALAQELSFVLQHAREHLSLKPSESDVLSVFAGLRPLVARSGGGDTAALSREHAIRVSPGGLLTITGGKWTTYRQMAADAVDHAARLAGLPRRSCETADLPLDETHDRSTERGEFAQYGAAAASIAALARAEPRLQTPLHPKLPTIGAEVVWHARHEMARSVEDVLARRCRALLLDAQASIEAAPAVARLLADELGRDDAWVQAQIDAFRSLAAGYLMPRQ